MIRDLKMVGVESTIGTYALGSTTYYQKKYRQNQANSKYLFETTLTLPCYRGVDVQRVVEAMSAIECRQP